MPRQFLEVPVAPAVLKWARETSGSTREETAQKLGIRPETFSHWEAVETRIRLSQVEKLAEYFKRPLAAFFLTEPPPETQLPTDFRVLPGEVGHFDRKTRLAIRKATRSRSVAKELMESMQRDPKPKLRSAGVSDDPEGVALRERKHLGIDVSQQLEWQNEWSAYRAWRALVEDLNILVFQYPMRLEDARGFSLSDSEPFAIALSSSDAVRARIFTLFHEFAHLLLRRPGICVPGHETRRRDQAALVETWCNRFSGALLVPGSSLRGVLNLSGEVKSRDILLQSMALGSREFKVSEQVVLRRMLDIGLVSNLLYRPEMQRLQSQAGQRRQGGGAVSPAKRCVGENGRLFTSLVLEANQRNLITYADVTDYLSLRLRYLPEVQSSLVGVAA
jgi:Zn-dependent peptidase ImmA (M78 family)/transcriptional regulator with XRE-family HTH domain